MNRILLLGAGGQLGQEIYKDLSNNYDILSLTKKECDITNYSFVEEKIKLFKPKVIINAAAYTNVDDAENNESLAHKINHLAVDNLARLTKNYKVVLIHFSTDYIFNHKINEPIDEDEKEDPINLYGLTKYLGEKSIIRNMKNFYILRISWVYGKYGKNFPKTILKLAKNKKELNIVSDQIGSPTPTSLISSVLNKLLVLHFKGDNYFGIYNLSPSGSCSWYEIGNFILEHVKDKKKFKLKTINKISSKEFKSLAKRPKYSYLDNSKIKKVLNVNIHDWKYYLKDFIDSNYGN